MKVGDAIWMQETQERCWDNAGRTRFISGVDGRCGLHSGSKAANALSKLVLIGKHAVAAEDVAPGKGSGCLLSEPCLYLGLVSAQSGEPGVGQCICGLKDPVRARDTVAPAQVLH